MPQSTLSTHLTLTDPSTTARERLLDTTLRHRTTPSRCQPAQIGSATSDGHQRRCVRTHQPSKHLDFSPGHFDLNSPATCSATRRPQRCAVSASRPSLCCRSTSRGVPSSLRDHAGWSIAKSQRPFHVHGPLTGRVRRISVTRGRVALEAHPLLPSAAGVVIHRSERCLLGCFCSRAGLRHCTSRGLCHLRGGLAAPQGPGLLLLLARAANASSISRHKGTPARRHAHATLTALAQEHANGSEE